MHQTWTKHSSACRLDGESHKLYDEIECDGRVDEARSVRGVFLPYLHTYALERACIVAASIGMKQISK